MKETSKCYSLRKNRGDFDKYLTGKGIDIGAGDDKLRIIQGSVDGWDKQNGDATLLKAVADNSYDFVYSSHCLEHLQDVPAALKNWARVIKSGGYIYFVVPDFEIYEKCNWPSRFNGEHAASFSLKLTRDTVGRLNHYHLSDLSKLFDELNLDLLFVKLEDDGYDYNKPKEDQTRGNALSQICFILKKRSNVFTHSGDLGDVIYSLATIKALGGGHLRFSRRINYVREPFTAEKIDKIKSFFLSQDYITSVAALDTYETVTHDLDTFRQTLNQRAPEYNLADAHLETFGFDKSVRDTAWLDIKTPNKVARVVINRTTRYRNDKFPWKTIVEKYGQDAVFVGSPDEYNILCSEVGVIPYFRTENLLELAEVIAGCDLFVGNQSTPYAIAEGLKKNTIQEVAHHPKNCIFERSNAIYGYNEFVVLPDLASLA